MTTEEGENVRRVIGANTVTVTIATKPPSTVLTMTMADPMEFARTSPLLPTETDVELDDHTTAGLVAFDGVIVAISCCWAPTFNTRDEMFREIPVTGTIGIGGAARTVTDALARN